MCWLFLCRPAPGVILAFLLHGCLLPLLFQCLEGRVIVLAIQSVADSPTIRTSTLSSLCSRKYTNFRYRYRSDSVHRYRRLIEIPQHFLRAG